MTLGMGKGKEMASRSGAHAPKRCGCGRRVTINFNGDDLCHACYQRMLKILAMDEEHKVIKVV